MNAPLDFTPHSVEAEQAVLGAVLINNDCFDMVAEIIEPDHFFEPIHQQIFDIAATMVAAGKKATPVTVKSYLAADITIAGLTIAQYLARLCAEATTILNAPDYAKHVKDLWQLRRVISVAAELQDSAARANQQGLSVEAILDDADAELTAIRFGQDIGGVTSIEAAVTETVDRTAKAYQGNTSFGITTGITTLDELIGPMLPGELVTVLAASGHGKSALAAQILFHAASPSGLDTRQTPKASLFASLEMPATQVARRAIAAHTGLSPRRLRTGEIVPAEFDRIIDASKALAPLPIYIDQTPGQRISNIARKAKAMKKRHGIAIVAVDHLLEIQPENPRWSQIDTVSNAARELKKLAKELDVVVLLLAQATREGQKRDYWRLRSQDIWGGDAVRQASDVFLSLAIPNVFIGEREPRPGSEEHVAWQGEMEKHHGKAEIGALKLRDDQFGGWRTLTWDGPRYTFGDE